MAITIHVISFRVAQVFNMFSQNKRGLEIAFAHFNSTPEVDDFIYQFTAKKYTVRWFIKNLKNNYYQFRAIFRFFMGTRMEKIKYASLGHHYFFCKFSY